MNKRYADGQRHYAGPDWWWQKLHPDTAPCWKCGVVTSRWVIGELTIGRVVLGTPGPDTPMKDQVSRGLLVETVYPLCQRCEDRHSIAVLEQRQQNLEILPGVRAREAEYLRELRAQQHEEAA